MKSKDKKRGFTIIELLTVMSIIVILISLLVPSLNAVRRYAKEVRQKGQFHDIGKGMEMFSIDFDGYPDSGVTDITGEPYCGAMKLCEAMVGQDALGFHPESIFRQDGLARDGVEDLYPDISVTDNRRERKTPYIDINKNKICSLRDLYGTGNTGIFTADPNTTMVLSDVFYKNEGRVSGEKLGMPVLYYKADVSKLSHDWHFPDANDNTYDYKHNYVLLALEVPGQDEHPMYTPVPIDTVTPTGPEVFYQKTWNKKITAIEKAYNEDSYILISAGFDGLYGTRDDVFNFAD